MSLAQRQADLSTIVTTLKTAIAACDVDEADPTQATDRYELDRIRQQFAQALSGMGFNSGEPQ